MFERQTFSADPAGGLATNNACIAGFWYGPRGELAAATASGQATMKDQYDGAGRRTAVFSVDAVSGTSAISSDIVLSQVKTKYDANGNPLFATAAERLPSTLSSVTGELTSTSSARLSYSGAFYDGADRITDSVDWGTAAPTLVGGLPSRPTARASAFHLTNFGYDAAGNQSTVTNPKGIVTLSLFDALHRPTQTTEAYDASINGGNPGTSNAAVNRVTAWTYNGDDQALTESSVLADSQHQTTAYVYGVTTNTSAINANNLLAAVQYPDLSTGNPSSTLKETYTRDATGAAATMTDRNGTVHAYTRDSFDRLTVDAITTFGTGVDQTVDKLTYRYDTAGNANSFTSYHGATVVNQVTRTLNGFGQVLSETQTNGTNTATVSYAYDTAANGSRLTGMTYPNGRVLNYTYTSGTDSNISRLSSITSTTGTNSAVLMESYSYLGDATPLVITRGNGIVGTTTLDTFGNTANLNWTKTSTAATVDDFSHTYDPNNNVLSKKNGVTSSLSELYTYDNLDRVTTFSRGTLNSTNDGIATASTLAGHSRTWTLDALGNQNATGTEGTSTSRSNNKQNELTQVGSNTLTYDNNGNQTTDENGNTLVYDAWNQLVKVESGATTLETLDYDALGRRIAETASGVTTHLYYSIGWQVLEERQSGQTVAQNVWSATYIDAMICRNVTVSGTTTRYWFQHDANFNTTSVTDSSGSVVERYVYDPYGSVTILSADGSLKTSSTLAGLSRYLSQGRRLDPITGTYDSRHRIYDPVTGTWKQPDPAGDIDGSNFYQSVGSNPTNLTDPSGLDGVGHHIVVQEIWKDLPDCTATKVWDRFVTGKLPAGHGWSTAHSEYNDAVKELYKKWLGGRNATELTEKEAVEFVQKVLVSKNAAIRNFLKKVSSEAIADSEKALIQTALSDAEKELVDMGEAQLLKRGGKAIAKKYVLKALAKLPLVTAVFFVIDAKANGCAYGTRNLLVPADDINAAVAGAAESLSEWTSAWEQRVGEQLLKNAGDLNLNPNDPIDAAILSIHGNNREAK